MPARTYGAMMEQLMPGLSAMMKVFVSMPHLSERRLFAKTERSISVAEKRCVWLPAQVTPTSMRLRAM